MDIPFQPDDIRSKTRSVREVVYEKLKESILEGVLQPGQHLRERELADLLYISTTPLKEALRRLEQEGLVITIARKGTYVAHDIMNSIEEIHWARSSMEGVAARLAALKRTEEEGRSLKEQVERMRSATERMETDVIIQLNAQFHQLIRDSARNTYLNRQIHALHSFDRIFRKKAMAQPSEPARAFQEHYTIYEHIMDRNAEGAEQSMVSHIRRTVSLLTGHVDFTKPC